jgi:hypothetical protein
MTSDSKKAKAAHVPKNEAAAKDKSTSGEVVSKTKSAEAPTSGEVVSKTESGEAAVAAPSNYSRGEGQKPVSAAYKENWNAIFAKKNAKKNAKKKR